MLTSLKKWYKNASARCDSVELNQAIIRIFGGLLVLCLITFNYLNQPESPQRTYAFLIDFFYNSVALLIIFAIIKNKFHPSHRKLAGAWLDISSLSLFISITSDVGALIVAVYLWVIFGNGFRYGKKYLYHAQALSIIGFLIATHFSPYWQIHQTISYSLLLMIVALPPYVGQLITYLHEETNKVEIARQKAADASIAKTQFVANMSHEIRTPLNGIIGISALLKTTPLNSDQQDLLLSLEGSSKHLLSLLNNVLDFTKIEERKFTLENIAFSPKDAIDETLEIFRAQANDKGIHLGASVSSSLGLLQGDHYVLRQVLANLLGNAIKFTQVGSVTVSATQLHQDTKHTTVRFEVADTGIGIPASKQSTIFESFTQADASTTRKFGGSGLGLTIAKYMVDNMGGTLSVHSTEGVGSHFWFILKLENPQVIDFTPHASSHLPVNAQDATSNIKPITKAYESTKPLKILVCEDESTNQKIITRLLSMPGHQVEIVSNADEMLDALEVSSFDLVVTDLNMSGMNGAEALKLYRFMQPDDHHTRFILFTADATLAAREMADDAGFDAFLTKPIDVATLFSTIERVLNLTPSMSAEWAHQNATNTVNLHAPTSDSAILSMQTLKELEKIGAGDDLFMHRLLKNYLADSAKQIANIEISLKEQQYGALQDYCHALKGNSLSIGANQLAEQLESFSKLGTSSNVQQRTEMFSLLNHAFLQLSIAVEGYLKRPEATSSQSI